LFSFNISACGFVLVGLKNSNNNAVCKAPECQKTSVVLADRNILRDTLIVFVTYLLTDRW